MTKQVAFTLLIILSSFNSLATQLNIKISHEVLDGEVFISGVTNLPTGTKIGVDVSSLSDGYSAQSYDLLVQDDGVFRSDGFTDKGKPLIGSYEVEVISYINDFWQNKNILEKLTKYNGIEIQDNEIIVKYSMNIGSASDKQKKIKSIPTEKQKTIVRNYCYAKQSALLCDYLQMRADTQGKIENQIGSKINVTKYNKTCLQGMSDALDDESKGLCSKVWGKFGCNGKDTPRLVQESPSKKVNANLCEY